MRGRAARYVGSAIGITVFSPSLPPPSWITTRIVSAEAAFLADPGRGSGPPAPHDGNTAADGPMQPRRIRVRRSMAISRLLLELVLGTRHEQGERAPAPAVRRARGPFEGARR